MPDRHALLNVPPSLRNACTGWPNLQQIILSDWSAMAFSWRDDGCGRSPNRGDPAWPIRLVIGRICS